MRQAIFTILLLAVFALTTAQNLTLPLWPDGVPNTKPSDKKEVRDTSRSLHIRYVTNPTITVYLPEYTGKPLKTVIVCPGGGYSNLSYQKEGIDVAKMFQQNGIAAIILKYRLPDGDMQNNKSVAPLQDAQRAVRLVRSYAKEWNLDENYIGIMGFSAGGHFVSTLGTHFDFEVYKASDKADRLSARPDFQVLVYPVISMELGVTHMGSRQNLIGKEPTDSLVRLFSNHLQVTPKTPETFLIHSGDDGAVPVQNSLQFYSALLVNNVSAEMHIFPSGGHGFGLAKGKTHLESWSEILLDWVYSL